MNDLQCAVEQVMQGNSAAFETIVHGTCARHIRLSARMLGSLAEAEDVVQEAYIKAYRSLVAGEFKGLAKVETWLYRIVANTALDALRQRERLTDCYTQPCLVRAYSDGAAAAEARVALAEVADLLDGLPAEQRLVMVLTRMEGHSSRDVAEMLEISE